MEIKVKKLVDGLHDINQANGTIFEPRKTFTLMRAISHTFRLALQSSCRMDTRQSLRLAQALLKSSASFRQTVSASLTTPIVVTMTNG